MSLEWMAWTWQTAFFFGFILLCLLAMTVWELRSPGGDPRRGILSIDTTRGDRLFISLLSAAFVHLFWLGILEPPLWGAVVVSIILSIAIFKWV